MNKDNTHAVSLSDCVPSWHKHVFEWTAEGRAFTSLSHPRKPSAETSKFMSQLSASSKEQISTRGQEVGVHYSYIVLGPERKLFSLISLKQKKQLAMHYMWVGVKDINSSL